MEMLIGGDIGRYLVLSSIVFALVVSKEGRTLGAVRHVLGIQAISMIARTLKIKLQQTERTENGC